MKKYFSLLLLFFICSHFAHSQSSSADSNAKPWTRWWWLGSIVTEEGITHSLEDLSKSGFGGVEIVPIYGVDGEEGQEVPYLSDRWLELLDHTIQEATRLDMGVDISIGSGWPIGGPNVSPELAAKKFEIETYQVEVAPDLDKIKSSDGSIAWAKAIADPKTQSWDIFLIKSTLTGQKVKRAGPGGAGLVMDHLNKDALQKLLTRFDSALNESNYRPRAFFNDSYEVYGANWTSDFLEEFKKRRGYDFAEHFHVLAQSPESQDAKLIYIDYQQTIADLLLEEFTIPLRQWTESKGIAFSNQAHGSPGNLLDLYAAADLPQTEAFGTSRFDIPLVRNDPDFDESRFGKPEPLTYKFASSAANLTGKKRAGSESFTWLADHFKIALSMVKPQVDELLLNGINHIFYHGLPYSPYEEGFPGWQFYAAVNFGPQAGFWNEIPLLNRYIANSQHLLQNSLPDQDVLLYFPIHDIWANSNNRTGIVQLDVHHAERWLLDTSVGYLAKELMEHGYQFDYISDRLLEQLTVEAGKIQSGESEYKAILIPEVEYIPLSTLRQLKKLANQGAPIFFKNNLPKSVAGWKNFEENQLEILQINEDLQKLNEVKISSDVRRVLPEWSISAEEFSAKGLSFLRKRQSNGDRIYFVSNLKNVFHSDSIELPLSAKSIQFYNPNSGEKGLARLSPSSGHTTQFYLQLAPGQSIFIQASTATINKGENWNYIIPTGAPLQLNGGWNLSFLPRYSPLPESTTLSGLTSWTELGDEKATFFGGTGVYATTFDLPADWNEKEAHLLKLGDVRESATVYINDQLIGKAWSVPFDLKIPAGILQPTGNELRIEVTNLAINQIIAIDRKGDKNWKKFKDANIVNINYQPFDASDYSPALSGLLGPVEIYRLQQEE